MISTHILDTSRGEPAVDVLVRLEKNTADTWSTVGQEVTSPDGRISFKCPYEAGTYRLVFEIDAYFARTGTPSFFTTAPVTFVITDTNRKYHVPLLLNPYGYSTYRGT